MIDSGNMLPVLSRTNKRDGGLANAECLGQRSLRNARRMFQAYFSNIVFIDNRALTLLFIPILHVHHMVAKRQMRGIAAGRIIACMQDMAAIGDRPFGEGPSISMRQVIVAFVLGIFLETNSAIAFFVNTFGPWPAGVRATGFINIRPKIFDHVPLFWARFPFGPRHWFLYHKEPSRV